jgi:aspartate racemase
MINQRVSEKLGGLNSARCLLYSINFHDAVETGPLPNPRATSLIVSAARLLEKAEADCIVICANTIHMMADEVERSVDIPLISLTEATARKVSAKGFKKVGLMGTLGSMNHGFYADTLSEHGIATIFPTEEEKNFIHNTIMNELAKGVFKDESKQKLLDIINRLHQEGCEGIILGCTELPLVISQSDASVVLFDTLDIHVEAIVEFAVG